MANHRAEQCGHVRFTVQEVSILNQVLRPGLEAQRVGGDDCASRQRALCDENLGSRRDCGFRLRSASPCKHTPGYQCSTDRNDQRPQQQNQLLPVHGSKAPSLAR